MQRIALVALTGLILLAGLWSSPAPALAGPELSRIIEQGELRVGLTPDNPPLAMRTAEGDIVGMEVDLARAMAKALGVRLSLMPLPFAELMPSLKEGRLDLIISGVTMTPERNAHFMFVGPYFITGQAVLTHAATAPKFADPEQYNRPEMVIAAVGGTTSLQVARALAPKATILEVEDQDQGVNALLLGKAQALVADHSFCVVAALRHADRGLAVPEKPVTFEPLGIVCNEDALLANWLGNFLQIVKGNGHLERMARRWFEDASWLRLLPADLVM